MADKEITSEMIIKALKECSNDTCHDCNACPLNEPSSRCIPKLAKLALDLMRNKDAKIAVESFGHANAKITIDSLLMELDGKDVEIMNLKHEIEKKDTEIEILIRKKHALREEIEEKQDEIFKLKAEISNLN